MKVDKTVRQETINIIVGSIILSMLMQAVFLIIGKWDYKVLLGNLLGVFGTVLNFFLMGLTIQSAILVEESEAKKKIRTSQTLRTQMLFIVTIIGAVFSCFNIVAVVIPLFFPRLIVMFRTFSHNKQQVDGGGNVE